MSSNEGIQATNDDASQCKRYAVEKGYWRDPYISLFNTSKPSQPRTPEINRGYYARVRGMKLLLDKFLEVTAGMCQIINLGAGFDTLYWRLCDENAVPVCYVDIDLPGTTARKCHCIRSRRQLSDKLKSEATVTRTNLHAHPYHLMGADITKLSQLQDQLMRDCAIDISLPTVFITECVLVYLQPDQSRQLLRWITSHFTTIFFINYEQVNMGDRFGEVMRQNLQSRDCELLGIEACLSLDSQIQRFLKEGFTGANAMHMMDAYRSLPADEVARIEKLEMLDDCEVIDQLFKHYCISWAYKADSNPALASIDMT